MKRKETYLSRDFRETAALRFPAQAKELNTAFDMRLDVYKRQDVIRGCVTGILTESMEKSWFGLFRLTFL